MPIRRVTTIRKRFENPEASCGRQLPTTRLGESKRAWWARGPALDKFENEILPDIETLLPNIGLGDADIYVRIYMIGSRIESAGPIIMVCCSNSTVRSGAESAIRRSDIPRRYPEFGLGASALPLEQPIHARALAGEVDVDMTDGGDPYTAPSGRQLFREGDVVSPTPSPTLGRKLFTVDESGNPSRCATGGVVLQIAGDYFQLFVDHVNGPEEVEPTAPSEDELDECHFDGQNDDDEVVSFEFDYEATSRESLTPVGRETSWAGSSGEDTDMSQASSVMSPSEARSPFPLSPSPTSVPDQPSSRPAPTQPQPLPKPNYDNAALTVIGPVAHQSRHGGNAKLDWALVPVADNHEEELNQIHIGEGPQAKVLRIHNAAPIGHEETRVVAITASGGSTAGVIIPGPAHFRSRTATEFQRLYTIQLEGLVVEGDCGAAVVDEKTGDFYGHIVRGCSGTQIAYIVPATEVLADIRLSVGADILLASVKNKQRSGASSECSLSATPSLALSNPAALPAPFDPGSEHKPRMPVTVMSPSEDSSPYSSVSAPLQSAVDPRNVALVPPILSPHVAQVQPQDWGSIYLDNTGDFELYPYSGTEYSLEPSMGEYRYHFPEVKAGYVDPSLIHPDLLAMNPPPPDAQSLYPVSPFLFGAGDASLPRTVSFSPSMKSSSTSPSIFSQPSSTPSDITSTFPSSYESWSYSASTAAPRRPSIVSFQSNYAGDEAPEKKRCPHPDCGKTFRDLRAHMLTHQTERPEKCPIVSCEYHVKGFARKYDKNRHSLTHYKGTMVCGFCPGSGSPAEKSFNRADVFKRHLTAVHGVEQTPPNSRRKSMKRPPSSTSGKAPRGYAPDATGKCSTCSQMFSNAQDFYEHLDDCVLRVVQQEDPSESINAVRLAEVENDPNVRSTLENHQLPTTTMDLSVAEEDDDDDMAEDDEAEEDSLANRTQSPRKAKGNNPAGGVQKSRGMTYSRGGVSLVGKRRGRRNRRDYPSSWGFDKDKMTMKKRVMAVFDGPRRLAKDDMMLSTEQEVRIKLSDSKSYVTDLDVQTLKRAEGFLGATDEEKGPCVSDDPNDEDIKNMMALAEA